MKYVQFNPKAVMLTRALLEGPNLLLSKALFIRRLSAGTLAVSHRHTRTSSRDGACWGQEPNCQQSGNRGVWRAMVMEAVWFLEGKCFRCMSVCVCVCAYGQTHRRQLTCKCTRPCSNGLMLLTARSRLFSAINKTGSCACLFPWHALRTTTTTTQSHVPGNGDNMAVMSVVPGILYSGYDLLFFLLTFFMFIFC